MSQGFITEKSALYAKHRQRATHGKDGRSIVHRRRLPKGTGRKQTLGIERGQRCHYECEP